MAGKGLLVAITATLQMLTAEGTTTGDPITGLNFTQIALTKPDPDKIERISYEVETYGEALDVYLKPKPIEIEIAFDGITQALLDLYLESSIHMKISGVGKNLFDGRDITLLIPHAVVSPAEALELISADPMSLGFKGTLKTTFSGTPPVANKPYTLTLS